MPLLVRICVALIMLYCAGCARDLNLREGSTSFRVQNYRDAFVRLMPEAKAGQPDAQYAIGYMYYYGQGVVENRKKAVYWIKRAASCGQTEAQAALKMIEAQPLDVGKPVGEGI